MARQRSLTPDKQTELCALVAQGVSLELAADRVGVTLRTVQREVERDEDFAHDLCLAEQAAPVNPLKLMEQAARTHWRAAAWLLERTDERYAKRKPNSCGPAQLQAALAAVIEAALGAAEPAQRKAVYQQAQAVAEQALLQIFPERAKPPLTAPAGLERNGLSRD